MTDTEIKNICKSNIGPYRFNYINAAKEIARNDRDEEETKSILVAVVRYYEHYGELKISDEEMAQRLADFTPKKKELSGYLKRYAALVSSGAKGAILNV